jgi:hypothetical protein
MPRCGRYNTVHCIGAWTFSPSDQDLDLIASFDKDESNPKHLGHKAINRLVHILLCPPCSTTPAPVCPQDHRIAQAYENMCQVNKNAVDLNVMEQTE